MQITSVGTIRNTIDPALKTIYVQRS